MERPIETPWGAPDYEKRISTDPLIMLYGTPSHGGYHLSDEALAAMPRELADIRTFAGRGWYEEDRDWAIVALAFSSHFDDESLFYAASMARSKRLGGAALAWLQGAGQEVAARVDRWIAEHRNDYLPSSSTTDGHTVRQEWIRIGDYAHRVTVHRDYDEIPLHVQTDAQLDAFDQPAAA